MDWIIEGHLEKSTGCFSYFYTLLYTFSQNEIKIVKGFSLKHMAAHLIEKRMSNIQFPFQSLLIKRHKSWKGIEYRIMYAYNTEPGIHVHTNIFV